MRLLYCNILKNMSTTIPVVLIVICNYAATAKVFRQKSYQSTTIDTTTSIFQHHHQRRLAENEVGFGIILLIVALCSIIVVGCIFFCCLNCNVQQCFNANSRAVIPKRPRPQNYNFSQNVQHRSPTSYNSRPQSQQEEIELVQAVPRMISTDSTDSVDGHLT